MANILEELWRGNVVPYGSVRHTPEMTQLMGYIARHHEKLTSNLTGELKETFEKLDDCWNEYAELCDKIRRSSYTPSALACKSPLQQ